MTSIPSSVRESVLKILQRNFSDAVTIQSFSFSGGGCINHGGKLTTSAGNFFLKWNEARKFPGMFAAEAKGLNLLRQTKSIHIPRVMNAGEDHDHQFLLLEYVEQNPPSEKYWVNFGERLASLHRISSSIFGLDHSNYIGSLPQSNVPYTHWVDFFIEQRLIPQLQRAFDAGLADKQIMTRFETLYRLLPSLLPEESPSLLHGDLWSGNLLSDERGEPCLIDPAVYFGHREVDLAMTTLFGGFDETYLASYQQAFPLLTGYRDRFDLYNLYPLLVHVNLFGGNYLRQVKTVLDRFIS